jgi:hypothetical protein
VLSRSKARPSSAAIAAGTWRAPSDIQPATEQPRRTSKWLVGGLVLLALGRAAAAAVIALGGSQDRRRSVNLALRRICEPRE